MTINQPSFEMAGMDRIKEDRIEDCVAVVARSHNLAVYALAEDDPRIFFDVLAQAADGFRKFRMGTSVLDHIQTAAEFSSIASHDFGNSAAIEMKTNPKILGFGFAEHGSFQPQDGAFTDLLRRASPEVCRMANVLGSEYKIFEIDGKQYLLKDNELMMKL